MKTENPYSQFIGNSEFKKEAHEIWQEGYAAAMADMQPIAFSERLPEKGTWIIVFNPLEVGKVVFDSRYISSETMYNFQWFHWLPLPTIPTKPLNEK